MFATKLRALSTKKKRMVYSTSQQLLYPNKHTDAKANNNNTTGPADDLKANYDRPKPYGNANIPNNKQHVKPLIVLDVNGILCHRYRKREIPQDISSAIRNASMKELFPSEDKGDTSPVSIRQRFYRDSIANIAKTPIIPRSDLNHFLRLLNDHFTLAVWTSAKEANANSLVEVLFPTDIARQLLFIWNQDQCDVDRDHDDTRQGVVNHNLVTSEHSNHTNVNEIVAEKNEMMAPTVHRKQPYRKIIYIKRLQKVWDEYPLFNKSNTLLIDDSPEKCPMEYKLNTLHPPPIFGLNQVALESLVLSTHYNSETESSNLNDKGHHGLSFDQYSDELNQQRQFLFFQRLAKHWESLSPRTEDDKCQHLVRFLEQYGKTHMNWRG